MIPSRQRLELSLTGIVQGVTLRANVRRFCAQHGLNGYVKNEADGSVTLVVEGPSSNIDELIDWLKRQPIPWADISVNQITRRESPDKFREFKIIW